MFRSHPDLTMASLRPALLVGNMHTSPSWDRTHGWGAGAQPPYSDCVNTEQRSCGETYAADFYSVNKQLWKKIRRPLLDCQFLLWNYWQHFSHIPTPHWNEMAATHICADLGQIWSGLCRCMSSQTINIAAKTNNDGTCCKSDQHLNEPIHYGNYTYIVSNAEWWEWKQEDVNIISSFYMY